MFHLLDEFLMCVGSFLCGLYVVEKSYKPLLPRRLFWGSAFWLVLGVVLAIVS